MGYKANIEGFEGQYIEINISFWTGAKLFVNGEPAPKGNKRGEFLLQNNFGKQVNVTLKPQILGLDVPQLVVEGKTINIVEPLKWYEVIWTGLPALLLFVGGAIGAIFGGIGFFINTKVFRSEMNTLLKFIISGVVTGIVTVGYFIVAIIFAMIINS